MIPGYRTGFGSKRKLLGTTGFGLFFLQPIGSFEYLFLTHSRLIYIYYKTLQNSITTKPLKTPKNETTTRFDPQNLHSLVTSCRGSRSRSKPSRRRERRRRRRRRRAARARSRPRGRAQRSEKISRRLGLMWLLASSLVFFLLRLTRGC